MARKLEGQESAEAAALAGSEAKHTWTASHEASS